MKHQEEAEVGGHEGTHHAELLNGGPHLIVERWTWYTPLIMLMMTMLLMRISDSPRQRQSTASASAGGLLDLQETWSKRSEAERSPLLFLISSVRSSSMQNDQVNLRRPDRAQRSGWRWEHQSWREQSVEQPGVELRRWGGRSTLRSSSWRSTVFLTSSLLNKNRMLSLLIYYLTLGTKKESSHNLQKC